MELIKVIENATGYDELIAGHGGAGLTQNVKLKSGTAYKRGMLISKKSTTAMVDGVSTTTVTYEQTGIGDIADYVLKSDVDATTADTVGTVYLDGRFHREKIIVVDGDTVEAHEDELRPKNIFFTTLK